MRAVQGVEQVGHGQDVQQDDDSDDCAFAGQVEVPMARCHVLCPVHACASMYCWVSG